jgi:hypothetical protein
MQRTRRQLTYSSRTAHVQLTYSSPAGHVGTCGCGDGMLSIALIGTRASPGGQATPSAAATRQTACAALKHCTTAPPPRASSRHRLRPNAVAEETSASPLSALRRTRAPASAPPERPICRATPQLPNAGRTRQFGPLGVERRAEPPSPPQARLSPMPAHFCLPPTFCRRSPASCGPVQPPLKTTCSPVHDASNETLCRYLQPSSRHGQMPVLITKHLRRPTRQDRQDQTRPDRGSPRPSAVPWLGEGLACPACPAGSEGGGWCERSTWCLGAGWTRATRTGGRVQVS